MKAVCLAMVMALLFTAPVNAEKEELRWAAVHWPPWMILEGPDKGQGIIDGLMAQMSAQLPQYQHIQEPINWGRYWLEASKGTHICNMMSQKTPEREKLAYFSTPSGVYRHIALIIRTDDLDDWGNPEAISLASVMQNPKIKGIVESARSYGPLIDRVLKQQQNSNLESRALPPGSIIEMLQLGRIDYTIEFPAVVKYLDSKNDSNVGLVSIPIQEMPKYGVSYMACPRNEWGKKVIEYLNQLLAEQRKDPELFNKLLSQHYSPAEIEELKRFYMSQLKGP